MEVGQLELAHSSWASAIFKVAAIQCLEGKGLKSKVLLTWTGNITPPPIFYFESVFLRPACLLESSFFLESEFRESEFRESIFRCLVV